MPIFAESDGAEAQPNTFSLEQEQLEDNEAAEHRLAEYDASYACEHAGNDAAETEAISQSAQKMQELEDSGSLDERREILQEIGEEMKTAHHTSSPEEIELTQSDPKADSTIETLGGHYAHMIEGEKQKGGPIEIQEEMLQNDPRKALSTYLHEFRHHEQQEEVEKARSKEPDVDTIRASQIEYETDHYIESGAKGEHFDEYEKQFVETDARIFAREMTDKILEKEEKIQQERTALDYTSAGDVTSASDEIARRRLASSVEEL